MENIILERRPLQGHARLQEQAVSLHDVLRDQGRNTKATSGAHGSLKQTIICDVAPKKATSSDPEQ
eukprot:CAMPEP_0204214428 /NCGR_PEP_ID=MMETSP0361-20130328/76716_1 /ASSEMBLY_ACC=CAM_ASM_000343 /TAXON_ID=268821 /ORGANISM="Scrippsiella Hangoei, Strain SHTV-5" /LENGTH=65 /DNA_ID=CAMNT_0051179051 /DNA_START=56 /DNA_END=251 /DNA_ORIENTATION=+